MPASIVLTTLAYATPDGTTLFDGLDLAFGSERTGLIGRNGTGKSTLLRLIAGELVPPSGSVARTGSLGLLRQTIDDPTITLAAALGVADALSTLDRIAAGHGSEDELAIADWMLPTRIEQVLGDLALAGIDLERRLDTLSGGQQTRIAIAALLLAEPDMILLDEPTNNLDADGRAAIIALLTRWRGGAIVVSHDRTLLRAMDQIVELTSLGAKIYGGNWDHYVERRAIDLAAAEHDRDVAGRKVVDVDRRVQAQVERKARKDSAGKKKKASGGQPRILLNAMGGRAEETGGANARLANRMRSEASVAAAEARDRVEVLQPLTVDLAATRVPHGRTILHATGLTGGPVADVSIIRNLDLTLTGPERLAIVGPNGSGKTTILKLLTGSMPIASGSVRINGTWALLDQAVSILDPALSIREAYRALNPAETENDCRAALARFKFRADTALQHVGSLSGGELLRAGLAATIGGRTPPDLLILDEPTNHLDIGAIEAVEAGLRAYDGALVVVSHDQAFLDAIGINRWLDLGLEEGK
jgi:ATPase subunit of ABC transporter with duplicated ATPase domains